jgi:hypothetical protein
MKALSPTDKPARVQVPRIVDYGNQAIGPVTIAQTYERIHAVNLNDRGLSEGQLDERRARRNREVANLVHDPIAESFLWRFRSRL